MRKAAAQAIAVGLEVLDPAGAPVGIVTAVDAKGFRVRSYRPGEGERRFTWEVFAEAMGRRLGLKPLPTPALDKHGAYETVRDGTVFRVFPEDGYEVPDRPATERELLRHDFAACPRCGQQFMTVQGIGECRRCGKRWTSGDLRRKALLPDARPDVDLRAESDRTQESGETTGWK